MPKLLIIGLAVLVAAIGGLLLIPRQVPPPEPQSATVLPEPTPLPAFSLQDASGAPFTRDDLLGRFSLMFFGFTNCPDVCPITLQVLANTLERLRSTAPDKAPGVVFVSVDPYRDTPERIAAYLQNFDPSFTGATASDEALAPLLQTLHVTVQKHEQEGENYNVVHNGTVYMIGPRAEWIALSSPPHEPATLAADIIAIRDWYEAGGGQAPSDVSTALPSAASPEGGASDPVDHGAH